MLTSDTPRDVLNEAKWRNDTDLDEVEVTYVHRGMPNDEATVSGALILRIERAFFFTRIPSIGMGETPIPYHRVKRIRYGDETVYMRSQV